MADAGLLPLPGASSRLDWSRLLEADQVSLCSMSEADQVQQALEFSKQLMVTESATLQAGEVSPALLTGKVSQLEQILMQLQFDLRKEQQDKVELQQQVQLLRRDNQRLHEESRTAANQLRRFTDWVLQSVDKRT
ncbi:signal-induced proliferation-associated 1-like protein 2 [Centroberyx affinis]|uniref:signal-induced proliferation-associated 1-like protein 2 n=1 Tax=Centroberyx affinis TaxID=166261 RepID=UPI003A5C2C3D